MYTHFQFVSSTERSDPVVVDKGLPPWPVYLKQYPAVLNLQIQSTVLINFPSTGTCEQCELHRPLDSNKHQLIVSLLRLFVFVGL